MINIKYKFNIEKIIKILKEENYNIIKIDNENIIAKNSILLKIKVTNALKILLQNGVVSNPKSYEEFRDSIIKFETNSKFYLKC